MSDAPTREDAAPIIVQEGDSTIELRPAQYDQTVETAQETVNTEPTVGTPDTLAEVPETPKEPDAPPKSDRELHLDKLQADRFAKIGLEQPAPQEAPEETTPPEAGREESEGKTYTVKVNGEDREIDEEQYRSFVQKELSADEKFRAAAEERRVAEKALQDYQALLAQQANGQPPTGVDQAAPPATGERQVFTPELVDQAFLNDDNQSVQARQEMANRLNAVQSPVDVVDQAIDEMDRRQALESVSDMDPTYKQLLTDPRMKVVTGYFSETLLQVNPGLSKKENLKRAADMARDQFPELPPLSQPPTPVSRPTQTKQAHAAANVSTRSVRAPAAPEPMTEAEHRKRGRAQLAASRAF